MPNSETRTVLGARDHARAQAGSAIAGAVETKPTIPATTATDLPDGVDPADLVWDETLPRDGYASRVVRRGVHLRITDLDGTSNVSFVLHHAARTIERLNVADTMKLQWNAYLGAGSLLLSDMGRVLCTILDDSTAAIDLLCGASTPGYPSAAGGTSGRERLILGLAKHGLTRRDLPPAANLFTEVQVDPDGALRCNPRPGSPGDHVTLRAELDLLVTLAVTPNPLEREPSIHDGVVRVTAWRSSPAAPDDPVRSASPEAQRAFENTDDVLPTLVGAMPVGEAANTGEERQA